MIKKNVAVNDYGKKNYVAPTSKVVMLDSEKCILAGSITTDAPTVTNAWENNEEEENW